jgi:hypothetical protein
MTTSPTHRTASHVFAAHNTSTANIRRWAVLRLILGLVQISGAAFSVALIAHSGITPLALGSVIVTGIFTGTSMWLFQVWKRGEQPNTPSRDHDQ